MNFNDPTGHDADCSSTDSQCKNQVKQDKANDILKKLVGTKTTWDKLSPKDQEILLEAGWNAQDFNNSDYSKSGVTDIAGTLEDPVVIILGLGVIAKTGYSAYSNFGPSIGEEGTTSLYRAVSSRELDDILNNHIIRTDPSEVTQAFESGKWFTNSVDLAGKWGEYFSKMEGQPYYVIEINMPQTIVNQMTYEPFLDYGPAWFADESVLVALNQVFNFIQLIK